MNNDWALCYKWSVTSWNSPNSSSKQSHIVQNRGKRFFKLRGKWSWKESSVEFVREIVYQLHHLLVYSQSHSGIFFNAVHPKEPYYSQSPEKQRMFLEYFRIITWKIFRYPELSKFIYNSKDYLLICINNFSVSQKTGNSGNYLNVANTIFIWKCVLQTLKIFLSSWSYQTYQTHPRNILYS